MTDYLKFILEQRADLNLLKVSPYKDIPFEYFSSVVSITLEAMMQNYKIILPVDYDTDGLCCAACLYHTFEHIGYQNKEIYIESYKYHGISANLIQFISNQVASYSNVLLFITDAGSTDIEQLRFLLDINVKVVILDHHRIDNISYNSLTHIKGIDHTRDIAILNSTTLPELYNNISAGVIAYNFCKILLSVYKAIDDKLNEQLFSLAALSLVSDVCSMRSAYNRSIISKFFNTKHIHPILKLLYNRYYQVNRQFLSYRVSPVLNTLFRTCDTIHIRQVVCTTNEDKNLSKYLINNYNTYKSSCKDILSYARVIDLSNICVCDISKATCIGLGSNVLYNFTGVIANYLVSRLCKTSVVVCKADRNTLKGSIRSNQNTNLYAAMNEVGWSGGGHKFACGFSTSYFHFEESIIKLNKIIPFSSTVPYNGRLFRLCNLRDIVPDRQLYDMAYFNEFAFGDVFPVGFLYTIERDAILDLSSSRNIIKPYNTYKTDNAIQVINFDTSLTRGNTVLIVPTLVKLVDGRVNTYRTGYNLIAKML